MLRPYIEADISKIVELEIKTLKTTLGIDHYLNDLLNPFAKHYVYEDGGIFIGFISTVFDGEVLEVLNFAVDPLYQSKGYGTRIFESLIEKIGESLKSIILEVRESNTKAIGLYSKFGFKTIRIRRGYYSNGEDAFFMQKVIK